MSRAIIPAKLPQAVARRIVVASLLVLLSALSYEATVHPGFRVVRVPLIDSDRPPTDRLVRVTLPDLSVLRQSVPVLTGRLASGSARSQRARVLLGERSRAEVNLAPGGHGSFALVLSEGTARAVTGGSGGQHQVRIVGEGDDWRLTRLDASNAYAALGPLLAIVPAQVPAQGPALARAWALLALVGALAIAFGTGFDTPKLRQLHQGAAGVPAIAMAVACLLPLVWGVRVLVEPSVFWTAVALVFGPALLQAAQKTLRGLAGLAGAAVRQWRRRPVAFERGGVLLGLVAMAISQPLFEVLRASPEFFVARNTSATAALAAAAIIGLALPLSLLAVERLLSRLSPGVATTFFLAAVALLVALMVHPWMRRRELADPWVMAGLALGAGALVAMATWRANAMRQFLAALAPAALVVPALFFASADVRGSLVPSSSRIQTPPLQTTPPIVLIVFDEFPLNSLLGADDRIDAVRFPHFAALARDASWFRETTAVSSQTVWAVPAIASGRYPVARNAVPTLRFYPQNLFTLLADRYQMDVFGRFLQLCPQDTCRRDLEGPGDGPISLVSDLGVVWLHIVVPEPLTERLPPVVGDWMGFARAGLWRTVDGRRVRNDRRSEFDRFLATMDSSPARLYFLHTLLPHMPFEYVPSERRYDAPDYQGRYENGAGLFQKVSAPYADALHQRHLLQVGFVDALVGRLVGRLRALGIYDQALVVVTADHGASYREGVPRRAARQQNLADIVRVPLLIKAPGQNTGAMVDGVAESVDILPTVAAILGMRLPFKVDGRSLVGDGLPDRAMRTFIDRGRNSVSRRDVTNWRPSSQVSLARRMSRFGVGGYDTFYTVPGTGDLLGRLAAEFPRRAGTLRVQLASPGRFADVDTASDTLPLHVRGRVFSRDTQPVAVVVNGRIAATTTPYVERGTSVFATMIPEGALRAGRNEIETFLVDRSGGATTLVSTLE